MVATRESVRVPPPVRPRPRVWRRRVVVGTCVLLVVALLVAGGGYVYLRWRLGQIHRVKVSSLAADKGSVMNVLLVGSDSRSRVSGDLAQETGKGEVTGQRSDTIMVLHIDSKAQKAAILSIPRDLWVHLSGTTKSDRVNASFSLGGAQGLIATIQENLGLKINHYMEVDFVGFRDIVNTVGGVNVYVPAPARDLMSGLNIKSPGCITFNGDQALAWVRSRHYEYYEAGRWREDPRSDLGRIQRQQDFIRRIVKKAVSTGITNPIALNRLIGIGVKDVTIDSAMSTSDIVKVARRFSSLNPDTVDMLTLRTTAATIGGAAVLKFDRADVQADIDRLNGVAPPPAQAAPADRTSDVRVRVLNGTGGEGVAAKVGEALQGDGFNVADRGDADAFTYSRTVVRYAPGQQAKAELLQRYLQAGATLRPDPTLKTVDLTVVVGADFSGVRATPGAGATGGPATTVTTQAPPSPVPVPKGAPPQPSC